jgi:dTDP-4-dehydrorhamnose reductase
MLGRALVPIFHKRYEVFPTDLEECDVRNKDLVMEEICGCKPRFVLHLAAMTDVDGCEKDPDEAFRTNTLGTRNVALACQRCNAVMVYINTGSVYNGSKPTPYIEFDTPDPMSIYARSKYQGELIVRDLLSEFYIFYAGWMFGGGSEDKKFVAKIMDLAGSRSELGIVDDKFGSPTYTVDLSTAIFDFIESGLYGKYHCVNVGCASRFEVAEEILRISGITDCSLTPVSSAEFPLPAPRPRMEAMRNYHFELLGLDPTRPWREALEDYITSTLL